MCLGLKIAIEVVNGFVNFKPKKIRFFGFDDWLVTETTRAFYGLNTEVYVFNDKLYRGVWEYSNGYLLCKDSEVYQVNVTDLARIVN